MVEWYSAQIGHHYHPDTFDYGELLYKQHQEFVWLLFVLVVLFQTHVAVVVELIHIFKSPHHGTC